ncbi:hypothetical protein [Aeromicrobium sp. 179-A 4D2 NHS]|uniref:hypothetical protein n=1 Tax=Aeromicrobium sp. 179-A 4D2 NHS TaxID=3142375 RepID=UPI0039A0526E
MKRWFKRVKDVPGTPKDANGGQFATVKRKEATRPLVSPVRPVTHENLMDLMLDERIPAEQWMAIVQHDDYLIRENAVAFASEGYFDNMMAWEAVDHLLQHEQNPIVLAALTRSNLPSRDWVIDEYRKGRVTSVDVAQSPVISHDDYRTVLESLTKAQVTAHYRYILTNPVATDEDRAWILQNKIDLGSTRAEWAFGLAVDCAKSPEALNLIADAINIDNPNTAFAHEQAMTQIPKNMNATPELLDRIPPVTDSIRAALIFNKKTPTTALERVIGKQIELLDQQERRLDPSDPQSVSDHTYRTALGRTTIEVALAHENANPETTRRLRTHPNPNVVEVANRVARSRNL